jgi:benzylsuccinate CoA-transferase BbsE subunit
MPLMSHSPSEASVGAATGPLTGLRILDLTDERGIYGAKLLADLGAEVIRLEPPGGDPLRQRGPHLERAGSPDVSLWHAFFASNRKFVTVDLDASAGRSQVRRLAGWADIVLDTIGEQSASGAPIPTLEAAGLDADALLGEKPGLVVVRVSSFGPEGPWRNYLAPDLVASALGGICATTGDRDTPPLKLFGELAFALSGAYAAVAALAALRHARETGEGQIVDVPVHECIASCLEHVFMFYWYHDRMPYPEGAVMPRRGSLHWSSAYVVMQALGGSIMVTPTPDTEAQVMWLAEEGAHGDLLDERWSQPGNYFAWVRRLMELLREWVATKEIEPFFFEAQARHAPFGWVLPPERIADNPQLEARGWWTPYDLAGTTVRGPGAPYRFSETPWQMQAYGGPGRDTASVLAEIGWESRP